MTTTYFMRFWSLIALLFFSVAVSAQKAANIDVPEVYRTKVEKALIAAKDHRATLERVLRDTPNDMKEGAAFLIAYMPQLDLQSIDGEMLLRNIKLAYKARGEFVWGSTLPDSIFLNEVLPYRAFSEDNDDWREGFYTRFSEYVRGCKTMEEAIRTINKNIRNEVQVDYNTKRDKADQNPSQSIRIGMASCTGLSILLVDALRAVGIPARMAGTPNWHDNRGNHSWVEVWMDGKWYFTEYYPSKAFNESWFLADAGKADPNSRMHAIYAASYKVADTSFPGWGGIEVSAHNVTERYITLYKTLNDAKLLDESYVRLNVIMYPDRNHTQPEDRLKAMVDVFQGTDQIGGGSTASKLQDANDYLTVLVEKNKVYTLKYNNASGWVEKKVKVADADTTVVLYQEEK